MKYTEEDINAIAAFLQRCPIQPPEIPQFQRAMVVLGHLVEDLRLAGQQPMVAEAPDET